MQMDKSMFFQCFPFLFFFSFCPFYFAFVFFGFCWFAFWFFHFFCICSFFFSKYVDFLNKQWSGEHKVNYNLWAIIILDDLRWLILPWDLTNKPGGFHWRHSEQKKSASRKSLTRHCLRAIESEFEHPNDTQWSYIYS